MSIAHNEFYTRIKRLVDDQSKQSDKEMWILKEILQAITTQPMLKIDTANCPSIEKLTDELELYRKYDTLSNANSKLISCNICDQNFKSPDSAVMHYFFDHQRQFLNTPTLPMSKQKSLSCHICGYNTYARHQYIGKQKI